jgi:hypothetical protein
MAKLDLSPKRIQIDKANSTVTMAMAIAAFVFIFALVSGKALLDQRAYNSRVIKEKEVAVRQLQDNIESVDRLVTSYSEFINRQENIIGGSSEGNGGQDGDNAKITLDALPSKYDFPALASSLEKLASDTGIIIEGIEGSDDEVAQIDNAGSSGAVEIPFKLNVKGDYDSTKALMQLFERSIRPIQPTTITITGDLNSVQLNYDAKTFYLPEKKLTITTKVVE